MKPSPGDERTVLAIDSDLFFVRDGWLFDRVFYSYEEFVSRAKPDFKHYTAYSEYFMDGQWHRRTTACGVIKHN